MRWTGILQRLEAEHAYDPACYRPGGCAAAIEVVASRITARRFNPSFPATFPHYLQKAIWHFSAETGQDVCNGNYIDDNEPCASPACRFSADCGQVTLRPSHKAAET